MIEIRQDLRQAILPDVFVADTDSSMKSWLITGCVGCGKSLAVSQLAKLFPRSVRFFSADVAAAEQLKSQRVIQRLTATFGTQVLQTTGEVCRQWLRDVVLPDTVLRKQLEEILHPLVLHALEEARDEASNSRMNLFLAEVPLHYEIGSTVSADFVIVVASSRSVQVRRMMETRGLDEQTVHKFLEAQWPIEAKVERADAVIWNDGSLAALEAQVLTLASPLLQA